MEVPPPSPGMRMSLLLGLHCLYMYLCLLAYAQERQFDQLKLKEVMEENAQLIVDKQNR